MQHTSMRGSRLIIATMLFISVLLLVSLPAALAQDDTVVDDTGVDEDHSGESCGECHVDYHAAWATGVHSIAYDRASFQDAWATEGNDPACLSCHTTDYRPATGEYIENIQCEACHGENPANHPPEPIVINTRAEICGDCHESTFDEWEHSLHAFTEDMGAIGCATCHNPHGQTIRFETTDALCLNCHQNNPENTHEYAESYVHITHNEIDYEGVEVTCASCHMYNREIDELHGLADHTMTVETVPCTDCHEAISLTGASPLLVDIDTALAEERDELRTQVGELETELAELQGSASEPQGTNFVQLTQGLIIGLGVGITLFWVLRRREDSNDDVTETRS